MKALLNKADVLVLRQLKLGPARTSEMAGSLGTSSLPRVEHKRVFRKLRIMESRGLVTSTLFGEKGPEQYRFWKVTDLGLEALMVGERLLRAL